MAKVTMPLMSGEASGSIAKAMTFGNWKGISVVRKWFKPINRKSKAQGDVRLILGGTGRALRCINNTSVYGLDAITAAGPQNTWGSSFVSYIIKNYMSTPVLFEAERTEFEAHTAKAFFVSGAAGLGLVDFDVDYKGTTNAYSAGLQLYMIAKYGIAKRDVTSGAFDRTPYTIAIADWVEANVTALLADLAAA